MSKYTDRAVELFKSGFNCSQAVFAAFSDKIGMDEQTALRVSAGLGGGVGRMREVCGAVSGAAMLAGMVYGRRGPRGKGKNLRGCAGNRRRIQKRKPVHCVPRTVGAVEREHDAYPRSTHGKLL